MLEARLPSVGFIIPSELHPDRNAVDPRTEYVRRMCVSPPSGNQSLRNRLRSNGIKAVSGKNSEWIEFRAECVWHSLTVSESWNALISSVHHRWGERGIAKGKKVASSSFTDPCSLSPRDISDLTGHLTVIELRIALIYGVTPLLPSHRSMRTRENAAQKGLWCTNP